MQAGATKCSGSGRGRRAVAGGYFGRLGERRGVVLAAGGNRLGVPRGTFTSPCAWRAFVTGIGLASTRPAMSGHLLESIEDAEVTEQLAKKPDRSPAHAGVCHSVRVPPMLGLNPR